MHKLTKYTTQIVNRLRTKLARDERGDSQPQALRLIPGMTAAPEPCQLATDTPYSEATHPKHAIGQVKIDGVRSLCLQTSVITRQAQPLDAALHCLPALHRLEERFGEPMVFDGEYQELGGFQATLSAMKRGVGEGVFYLFDAVPYSQWCANRFDQPLEARLARIEALVRHDETFLTFLPPVPLPTPLDAVEAAEKAWAKMQEGIVVKDAKSLYTRGRNGAWQKLKRALTLDGVVTDVVVPDGELSRAIALVRIDGRVHKVAAMPHELREMIWRDINGRTDGLTGRMVEVEIKEYTEAGNLREPKITRLRPDKDEGER